MNGNTPGWPHLFTGSTARAAVLWTWDGALLVGVVPKGTGKDGKGNAGKGKEPLSLLTLQEYASSASMAATAPAPRASTCT